MRCFYLGKQVRTKRESIVAGDFEKETNVWMYELPTVKLPFHQRVHVQEVDGSRSVCCTT